MNAYFYRVTIALNKEEVTRGGREVYEYFIPQLNLFINQYGMGDSKKARNLTGCILKTTTALTRVSLSESIVAELKELNKEQTTLLQEKYRQLLDKEEFSSLFSKTKLFKADGLCHFFVDANHPRVEEYFDEAYQAFGNDILPNLLLKHFKNSTQPSSAVLEKLYKIFKNLDIKERESLAKCLQEKLAKTEQKKSQNSPNLLAMVTGATVVGGLIWELTKNTSLAVFASITGAALTFFGKHYLQNNDEQFKKQVLSSLSQPAFSNE